MFAIKPSSITLTATVATLLSAPPALAEKGDWYINPMIGYQWFDSDRDLDDSELLGIGAEYHYSDRWAVELKYLHSSPDGDNGDDADLGQLIVESMYLLRRHSDFQPYLAAGIGHADFDYDSSGSDKDTQITAGVGVRYWFSERWSGKTDLRALHGLDDGDNDQLLTLSISYAFGSVMKPEAKPEPAAIAPAPAPKDSDGDGVVDSADKCPNTPAGASVDSDGCPEKLTRTESISLDIKFASDSDVVTSASMSEIEKIANFMHKYVTVHGTIEGHTDDTGKAEYNKSLSQRRANAVRQVLIDRFGIDASRLDAVGYGEEKPVADNATAQGRQENRRVVAVFDAEVTE